MKRSAVLLAGCLAAAACATPDEGFRGTDPPVDATTTNPTTIVTTTITTTTTTTLPVPETFALPTCSAVPRPAAPDDWYRDEPQYVGNEMPIEEVHQFAAGLPGFEVVWIERDRNGWVSVGFHGTDVEARHAELAAEFPGDGVVAVAMPYSQAELEEIRLRIDEALPEDMYAGNVFEVSGVVEVWVGDITVERVAAVLEVAGDDPVCINGWEPGFWPPEGPQPDGGDGWRYLGEVDASMGFDATPRLAANAATWAALWLEFGQGTEPPVDFEVEIAVALEIGHSSSCPETRLDGVIIEATLIYPEIVQTTRSRACTSDYNPRIYFFTVARDRLPDPPFLLVSRRESVWATQVNTDLSGPGSTPAPGDGKSVSVTPPLRVTTYPLIVEPGYPWSLVLQLSCGIERLGEVNGYSWRTNTSIIPGAWVDRAEEGLVDLDLLLEEGSPPVLTLSGHGASLEYRIDDGQPTACG